MIELVVGGVRSGKSRYAQRSAEALSSCPVFVATATPEDAAMAERIDRHQRDRGAHWRLVEEPLKLCHTLRSFDVDDVVVVDCLTLWLSNWLSQDMVDGWPRERDGFLRTLNDTRATILLVTNEVGWGVVPMGQLSRDFVDWSGWLHQEIAALADRVTLMHFGIPTGIKGHGMPG